MKNVIFTFLFLIASSTVFATAEKKTAKIRATGPDGHLDETTIYFDLGITPSYSPTEDAPKVYSNIPNAPAIFSLTSDNVYCSTNGYSALSESETIPIGIRTDTLGTYVFTASTITNFDSTSIIQLEDRQENVFTNLRSNFYSVELADSLTSSARFFIHVSRPVRLIPVTAGCANNDGALQIDGDSSILWTHSILFDSTGNQFDSFENITGGYGFSNLPEGNYTLVMIYGDYTVAKTLHVMGNYITTTIQPSTLVPAVNQEIDFYSNAHNATEYQWDMGDEIRITGVANPTYAYSQPGNYKVVLITANEAGCEYRDSVTVSVSITTAVENVSKKTRNIWAYDKTVTVVVNEEIKQGAELRIYNLLGQPIHYNPVTEPTTEIDLNDQPSGYYIVSLKNSKVESTKRIFLGK